MKVEIEIPDKELETIHKLQSIDKSLREKYESIKAEIGRQEHDLLVQAINQGTSDINGILLTCIYNNKDWQAKE